MAFRQAFGYSRTYEKWGVDVVKSGYTVLPNRLISINRYLARDSKLSPTDMSVLIVILSNWNDAHIMPAASRQYISERVNISPRQVQRVLSGLERKGVLFRGRGGDKTGGANVYDIRPLLEMISRITKAQSYADQRFKETQLELSFSRWGRVSDTMVHPDWAQEVPSSDDDVPF